MNNPIITLLTDFGVEDAYVAQMKGQILSICPAARLVDITHAIPAQDIAHAALVLAQAVPYFPADTIHVAIVDPGVGTERPIIAVELATQTEVGGPVVRQRCVLPDNGLIGRLASHCEVLAIHRVTEPRFWRSRVSSTFHGRDIMGPVAAHWAAGADREAFGPRIEAFVPSVWPEPMESGSILAGEIIAVDHFGNAITNFPARTFEPFSADDGVEVIVGGRRLEFQPVRTYGQRPLGSSVILSGSHELVELAVVGGNAAERYGIKRGEKVSIRVG